MQVSLRAWLLFGALVLSALALDLGLFSRSRGEQRDLSLRAAAGRSIAWIVLSLLFGVVVFALYGQQATLAYLTAYLLEKTLSIDNIFVFVLIFSELRIPPAQQRSVLLSDIVFALDSVPAVLAVTQEPFIVYTSNVFAMLGLRSLYFVLAGVVDRFRFLRVGLAVILIFFGARLLLSGIIEVPNHVSLGLIAAAL